MIFLKWMDKIFLQVFKALTMACFVALTILVSANVFVRFFPVASLHWFDEIIELLYAYLIFYGAAALWITREHFSVGNWIGSRIIKGARARHFYRLVLEVLVLVFSLVFFFYSFKLTAMVQDVTNVFAIPKSVLYSCMPIAGAVMVVYSIRNIIHEMIPLIRRAASQREGLKP
jgi:TRAP-type C4-dicarboxylate transport system permease small subunit